MDNLRRANNELHFFPISVVVPVFNCKKYLPEMIEGFLKQEYGDFELLLIDDGSTDGSGVLCDQFAAQDPHIRVIHQVNGGVSRARNRGLDEARGEYVVFVDADDRIRPRYLLDLISAARGLGKDRARTLILSDYQPFSDVGREERSFPKPFSMDFTTKQGLTADHFRELIFQFRLFPPYCKLYRLDIIEANHIRFREGMKSAEDFDFNIRYLSAVDHLEYIDSVQYDYRVGYKKYVPSNHGVLGKSEITSAHIMAHGITDLAARMEILEEAGPEIDLWAANKHYFNRLRMLFRKNDSVSVRERKQLYTELLSDPVYSSAAKRGAKQLPKSTTKLIAKHADNFCSWLAFYWARQNEVDKQ